MGPQAWFAPGPPAGSGTAQMIVPAACFTSPGLDINVTQPQGQVLPGQHRPSGPSSAQPGTALQSHAPHCSITCQPGSALACEGPTVEVTATAVPVTKQVLLSGLENAGNSCYLNAIVQQLFMLPDVRLGLIALGRGAREDHALSRVLGALMQELQAGNARTFRPEAFWSVVQVCCPDTLLGVGCLCQNSSLICLSSS
jgi:hypothetical protein